jgi:hypothetical protein
MQGYETMWTDLAALCAEIEHIDLTHDHYPGVGWPVVVGKFKAEGGGTGQHVIRIAATCYFLCLPNL